MGLTQAEREKAYASLAEKSDDLRELRAQKELDKTKQDLSDTQKQLREARRRINELEKAGPSTDNTNIETLSAESRALHDTRKQLKEAQCKINELKKSTRDLSNTQEKLEEARHRINELEKPTQDLSDVREELKETQRRISKLENACPSIDNTPRPATHSISIETLRSESRALYAALILHQIDMVNIAEAYGFVSNWQIAINPALFVLELDKVKNLLSNICKSRWLRTVFERWHTTEYGNLFDPVKLETALYELRTEPRFLDLRASSETPDELWRHQMLDIQERLASNSGSASDGNAFMDFGLDDGNSLSRDMQDLCDIEAMATLTDELRNQFNPTTGEIVTAHDPKIKVKIHSHKHTYTKPRPASAIQKTITGPQTSTPSSLTQSSQKDDTGPAPSTLKRPGSVLTGHANKKPTTSGVLSPPPAAVTSTLGLTSEAQKQPKMNRIESDNECMALPPSPCLAPKNMSLPPSGTGSPAYQPSTSFPRTGVTPKSPCVSQEEEEDWELDLYMEQSRKARRASALKSAEHKIKTESPWPPPKPGKP
ncbi:hypothetical protein OPT61_g8756 [Boeremia exigua]|uniref:Uncharacterized protein n=1 Tax=Boeremia exigua TaxID=749465 RepID=A0ACC2HY15_9PLEO|nr:hypothetical protein OPT61_g8756 [Boeremia exigua]